MKYRLFLFTWLAACHAAQSAPDMTTLAITGHTAEPAALYAVLINRNPGILYETAEPLSAKRAVHAKVSPDAPIAELALEARYRTQTVTARCEPPAAPSGKSWRSCSTAQRNWLAVGRIDFQAAFQARIIHTAAQNFLIIRPFRRQPEKGCPFQPRAVRNPPALILRTCIHYSHRHL